MDKDDRYTRITLRIPRDLHELLGRHAEDTSKSMNAEIIARLEETFEIDKVLTRIAPGAHITGTAGLLSDLDDQLEALHSENQENAVALTSEAIRGTLFKLDTLPCLTAALALQSAYPEAMSGQHKERLVVVIARLVGSTSKDPAELLQSLSDRLIAETLENELGL